MSIEDWKLAGYIGLTLGLIFLVGAASTYFYEEYSQSESLGYYVYPYRFYTASLLVPSLIFAVIGVWCLWQAGVEKRARSVSEVN